MLLTPFNLATHTTTEEDGAEMERFREGLRAFWQALLDLWDRATNGSVVRQRLFAIIGALLVLAIAGGVVLAAMTPDPAPQQVAHRAQPTATLTLTPSPTLTATAKPTAKPTVRPTPRPVPTLPPPPPIPTKPPTSSNSNPTANFCPTPTPLPAPTATNTPVPTATSTATATATTAASATASSSPSGGTSASVGSYVGLVMPAACQTCPYYAGNNPSQSQIATALANAAATYGLPVNLVKAIAWQESHWHEDVTSCDGGIGLMQVQYYVYPWLNSVSIPSAVGCPMSATNYNPYTAQGNADLGAKYLKYLYCYYSFWGSYNYDANGNPHTLSNPSKYTADWYYQQANLPYPDSSLPNSLCASVFTQNAYYPALPSSKNDPWSCPFSATPGDTTVLDITVSAYNEGPGAINQYGINNMSFYVDPVEGYIPQFASGALP
ncbi:MAG TPA: transglycosylase SLT domain-containing protein [Ktedonobacterales bacterium]